MARASVIEERSALQTALAFWVSKTRQPIREEACSQGLNRDRIACGQKSAERGYGMRARLDCGHRMRDTGPRVSGSGT